MKEMIKKYLTLLGMLLSIAWFFWNPSGWNFNWEPVIVFLGTLVYYLDLDRRQFKNKMPNKMDVQLFEDLRNLLPSVGPIKFIKDHDFLSSFFSNEIDPFFKFRNEWDNSEHQFVDIELESMRKQLYKSVSEFCNIIALYTSPTPNGFQSVHGMNGNNYDPDKERQYQMEVKEIHDKADVVIETHQLLLSRAREKLGEMNVNLLG